MAARAGTRPRGYFAGREWRRGRCDGIVRQDRDPVSSSLPTLVFEGAWPDDRAAEILAKAYLAARRVYCVSNHNLKLLEDQIGQQLPNASVIRNPFNVPANEPPEWPNRNGIWNIACVGRLELLSKGQDLLLRVLSKPQWRDRPVRLNLFGEGPHEQTLRNLAAKLTLENVSFRGHVTDIRGMWEENHLLVLPSRFEGLPLSLVEAMWCARPGGGHRFRR